MLSRRIGQPKLATRATTNRFPWHMTWPSRDMCGVQGLSQTRQPRNNSTVQPQIFKLQAFFQLTFINTSPTMESGTGSEVSDKLRELAAAIQSAGDDVNRYLTPIHVHIKLTGPETRQNTTQNLQLARPNHIIPCKHSKHWPRLGSWKMVQKLGIGFRRQVIRQASDTACSAHKKLEPSDRKGHWNIKTLDFEPTGPSPSAPTSHSYTTPTLKPSLTDSHPPLFLQFGLIDAVHFPHPFPILTPETQSL